MKCNHCGWVKPNGDPSPCPKRHTSGFTAAKSEDLTGVESSHDTAPTPARKPPTRAFKVLYRWDGYDSDPIDLGEIRAKDFNEANAKLPSAYAYESVRLPDSQVAKIDFDKLEVVQVASKPRKPKEAAVHAQ